MPDRIEREAAAWALRHPVAAADRAELDAWLRRNPRHEGALLRSMAGLSVIENTLAPNVDAAPRRGKGVSRRWMLAGTGGALAASFAGVLGWSHLNSQYVATERGEIRRLPLADGSVATINTASALRITMARDSRRIALEGGQAWFQVAKDRTRPFIVDAGIAQARAVGTAFSVSRGSDGVQVAVTEGTVAVWQPNSSGEMTILKAGDCATFRPGVATPSVVTQPAKIERALAWRNGDIALENETLGEAIAQFNRYNRQQLVLADPSLAHERLVGLFKLDKPENFAAMLSASLNVELTFRGDEIRLSRKRFPAR
ncbi:FecR domain-containing protein [Sphingomonas sp. HITSZ_GF]|uniref:FecR family protein n=1 Tax=Sphingomonas sp. HITSZ_GF TaxID=3037247 RepID=UPI00240E1601|nr:FecR domain-containing protein [Sphingomonas sp. HITSZ_GF]MDG2535882.1 FecR domain-containing protein [Sphingomonas sp. HITSZ_GF]